jgi:PKD domain-containing protein/parallel beta helix pectate lyase-like protein/pectate lyase-like protein
MPLCRTSIARAPIVQALAAAFALLVSAPAFPVTYVVDPSGDDQNSGTIDTPWRTVQHAVAQAVAGDAVVIQPGTYAESVHLDHGGSVDAPIIVTAAPGAVLISPDATASAEAIDIGMSVAYVTLNGIEATGGFDETVFLRQGAHDIRITGCNLHHNHAGMIMDSVSGVTVEQCTLHENVGLGMRLAGSTHDVVVRDTASVANGTGDGVCNSVADGFAAEPEVSRITFENVQATGNGGDGFDLKADHVVLDGIASVDNACTGIKLWQSAAIQTCLVIGNARGIGVTSITGGSAVSIVNCTVAANAGVGLDFTDPLAMGVGYTVSLLNTIVAGDFKAIQYVAAALIAESHNILFRTSLYDPVIAPVGARAFSDHDVDTGRWRRNKGQGAGTLAVDPLFVDPAHGDFHLKPTSAAIGRGQAIDPGSDTPNIGVYQQPVGPTNHAPWADAGRDRSGRVNRKVRFNAKGSIDPDGDPLTYSWDFGDGSAPALGFRVRHVYAVAGTYTVTLTASDGSLASSAAIHVAVE